VDDFATLEAALGARPRVRLTHGPTPLVEWERLSKSLAGPRLLCKRDDLTGLATGGNKTRKLEFLVADALAHGADTLITAGGPQSNHCRQTAAAAAIHGLDAHLVLGGQPVSPADARGNLFLDRLLGATCHFVDRTQRLAAMHALADDLSAQGRTPYVIPVGGSNAVGTLGYVAAMVELARQAAERGLAIDRIVVATSSGGTQAGLTLGARLTGFAGRITAISIDNAPDADGRFPFRDEVCALANASAKLLQVDARLTPDDFAINHDYLGGGYGVIGEPEIEATRLLATLEGTLVGPVYTARCLAGLIDLVRQGTIAPDETVLFWHTGDDAALHAYTHAFARPQ
jgi:D-cysteine desulfhydrase